MKRKPPYNTIALIIFSVLLGAASGPVGNALEFPTTVKPFALPLFLTLAFVLSIIAVCQYFLQEKTDHPTPTVSIQNRQHLLAKVRAFWISGVLEQSLHRTTLIALGLRDQPDVLADPWHLILQQPGETLHTLPEGTRTPQVYDDTLGELLILGEPGSGKTTLLLELARNLLSRAESDESHPMPMVFNLSSWAVKRQPLADWLVEEMNTKYQVPRHLGQFWVTTDQVLPLLDGLDEVDGAHRAQCVGAINTYRQEHGLVPMVVCSRTSDYLDLKPRLLLRSAVEVQPLTSQQIAEYLSSAGGQTEAVRVALRDDLVLQELATTPLMLSVLTLAYYDMPIENLLSDGSNEMRRRKLFADYVHRMLQRRGIQKEYTSQQTMLWLTWLARQLVHHSQTEFYVERMQVDWLPDARSRVVYHAAVGLVVGLLFGLVGGLLSGLLFGLVGGLVGGLVSGLLFGLFFELTIGQREIEPAEVVTWSWQHARRGLVRGLVFGLVTGLVTGLFRGLVTGVLFGLFGGLFRGLLGGLSPEMLDTHKLDAPNRGIWRSAQHGVLYGLLFGLVTGLFGGVLFGLVFGLLFGLVTGLVTGMLFGLFGGVLFGLLFGGGAYIQHFALRWFLWRAGVMPWTYPRFLDYAAERILLRKVGAAISLSTDYSLSTSHP